MSMRQVIYLDEKDDSSDVDSIWRYALGLCEASEDHIIVRHPTKGDIFDSKRETGGTK